MATLQITSDELRDIRNDAKLEGLMIAQQDPNITPETDLEGFQNQGGYAPDPETRTPGPLTPRQKGRNVNRGDAAQRRNEAARGGEQLTPEEIWPNYPNMLQIKGGMPPEINPGAWDPRQERRKQRIRDLKQGNQNPNEKKSAEQKQSPRERIDIPDFLQNIDIKPQDLLKILQGVAAFGGSLFLPQLQMGQAEGDGTQIADASALTNYLDSAGRNQRTGSFKDTPLRNDPKKLIETLLIGAEKFKA